MNEMDEIKQRKMEEVKKQYEEQQAEHQMEQQLESMMRTVLTDKAKARLANIKMVNKEIYFKAVQAVIYLYNAGQITGKLDDEELKSLLKKLTEKKEMKIRRK